MEKDFKIIYLSLVISCLILKRKRLSSSLHLNIIHVITLGLLETSTLNIGQSKFQSGNKKCCCRESHQKYLNTWSLEHNIFIEYLYFLSKIYIFWNFFDKKIHAWKENFQEFKKTIFSNYMDWILNIQIDKRTFFLPSVNWYHIFNVSPQH